MLQDKSRTAQSAKALTRAEFGTNEKPSFDADLQAPIRTTGNPFVDTGLAVLANKAKLNKVNELRLHHLFDVHNAGNAIAKVNSRLKSFTMFFTTNSLLTQPAIRDPEKRIEQYKAVTTSFLLMIGRETIPRHCESCGNRNSLDLDSVINSALIKFGGKAQERFVGRDWFPLAGSLGSDAQALPSASRAPALCALCLFAVQYAPLASVLFEGKLALFASTDEDFWYEIVSNIYNRVQKNISAGSYETLGKKGGTAALVRLFLDVFSDMAQKKEYQDIPADTVVHIWQFSNAQSQECRIHQIPNKALRFLHFLVRNGLRDEVIRIVSSERARPENTFLQCVLDGRDYFGLYPRKKYRGASPELFATYQNQLLRISARSLKTAFKISNSFYNHNKDAERFRIQFSSRTPKFAPLKAEIVKLVVKGDLEPSDYYNLFPLQADDPTKTENWGWNLIRYYLLNHEDAGIFENLAYNGEYDENLQIAYYASSIYNESVELRGQEGFQKKVMEPLQRGEVGKKWLRIQFQKLARKYAGFTYVDWSSLFLNKRGETIIYEAMFRMRLLWARSLAHNQSSIELPQLRITGETFESVLNTSGLPNSLQSSLIDFFNWYKENRGIPRFENILMLLQRGTIGLNWVRERLIDHSKAFILQEWVDFLSSEVEGSSDAAFQVILFFNNLYRTNLGGPEPIVQQS